MKFSTVMCALALLAGVASAQFASHIEIQADVSMGTSMQIYLDFNPASATGGVPPLMTDVGDALVVVEPTGEDLTSSAFGALLSGIFNDSFRSQGLDYKARFREKDGDFYTHDTVTIFGPARLDSLFISPDAATHPNMEVTAPPGISFNPNFGNVTRYIEDAYPGSPNAQLLINDEDPAVDLRHVSEVVAPGPLKFSFLSGTNANQPITFLLSQFYNPENIPQSSVQFPGSLDIGTFGGGTFQNVQVVADGNTFSSGNIFLDSFFHTDANGRFDFLFTLSAADAGAQIAAQAVIADPTQAPVALAFTQAANINAATGKEIILSLGDDGGVNVPFEPGKTFDFYGATYNGLNINANGFVTFGPNVPSGPSTNVIDSVTALGGEPTIFVNWSDWDVGTSAVIYEEFGNEVRIRWGTPAQPISHAGGSDIAWFGLTLHLDSPPGTVPPSQRFTTDELGSIADSSGTVFLDMGRFIDLSGQPAVFDGLYGISPGMVTTTTGVYGGGFALPRFPGQGGQALVVQNDLGNSAISSIDVPSGGPALYENGQSVDDRSFGFFPTQLATGSIGYVSIADGDQFDDLQGIDQPGLSASANGSNPLNFVMVGYFRYLYSRNPGLPLPQVELIDVLTQAPFATATIDGLMTPNGPADAGTLVAAPLTVFPQPGFRPFEGALLSLPPNSIPPGLVGAQAALRVVFPTGDVYISRETFPITP